MPVLPDVHGEKKRGSSEGEGNLIPSPSSLPQGTELIIVRRAGRFGELAHSDSGDSPPVLGPYADHVWEDWFWTRRRVPISTSHETVPQARAMT